VRLLELTLIRVGNEEYARQNDSFGLATMRDRHVRVNGSALRFHFRGKSGIRHAVDLEDHRLARIVRQSRDLPGYELFQYVDDAGERRAIDATDVNAYLKSIAGDEFTAKDFRTWAGTVLCARELRGLAPPRSAAESRRNLAEAIAAVAGKLGNTKAVCRKCYVHPSVIEAYEEGSLTTALRGISDSGRRGAQDQAWDALTPEEKAVMELLRQRSREAVAELTGRPARTLSYPFGRCNERCATAARDAGFEQFDVVAGGETAGIPYAAWIADRLGLPMQYIRKKPKGFGRNAQIEGDIREGARTLLVEDLTTDGRSKINFCKALREAGAVVEHVFVNFYYDIFPESKQVMADLGVRLHHLATWWDVLKVVKQGGYLANAQIDEVEKFLNSPAPWSAAHGGASSFPSS